MSEYLLLYVIVIAKNGPPCGFPQLATGQTNAIRAQAILIPAFPVSSFPIQTPVPQQDFELIFSSRYSVLWIVCLYAIT